MERLGRVDTVKKLKFAYVLISFAAIGQGVLWINVFNVLHSGIMAFVGGLPIGIATVGIATRAANILPRVQSKRARQAGWLFLFVFIAAETLVLGTANFMTMVSKSYVVAYGVSLVVTLVLVLGAIVDRSLIAVAKPSEPVAQPNETIAKPKRNKKKVAKQPITDKQLNDYWLHNPDATNVEVAERFGVTPQAISKRRAKLYSVNPR